MARVLMPGGQMMVYVWAMEQKNRRFEKQDVFVPWNKALCSRHFSESNQSGDKGEFVHAVKSQDIYPAEVLSSDYSYQTNLQLFPLGSSAVGKLGLQCRILVLGVHSTVCSKLKQLFKCFE